VERVLHPDLERVLEFYHEQRRTPPPVYAHSARHLPAVAFFSLSRLQQHLNNPLLTPSWVTLMTNGNVVSLEPAALRKVVQDKTLMFMDKAPIDEHLSRGGALLLEGLDILDGPVNAFISKLDSALPCTLSNCVAFLSQRGSEAYRGHCDTDDVLVIQIEGEKRWRIFAPQQRRYVDNALDDARLGRQVAEIVMAPGDVLYVRAGVPHRCNTVSEYSLHVSIDLCDRTPNIEQITYEANARYNQEAEQPYQDTSSVTEKYVALLRSEQFQKDLAAATSHVRKEAITFRQRIGRASGVRALDRLRRQTD
jgi:ribosomal protein L16 Arg81 hydroxylase